MKKVLLIVVAVAILLMSMGCAIPKVMYKTVPPAPEKTNKYFTAKITPYQNKYGGIEAFDLAIVNHTDKDLELVWDKTMYIRNGNTTGGFMFTGVLYVQRNNPKPPDVIFAGSRFSKRIFPCALVSYHGGRYGSGWVNNAMPLGEHGVYLTVKADGKEVHEKLKVQVMADDRGHP